MLSIRFIPPIADAAKPAADAKGEAKMGTEHALKVVTMNTGPYAIEPSGRTGPDRRSVQLMAVEDMHIVGLSHFTGVQAGTCPSDNGHVLSLKPENPWEKWAEAMTGMEPTGTTGYFGYCGRDYYTEVGGIGDIMWQELMPAGCHILVRKGETLYMHCYAYNPAGDARAFHHMVKVYYW
jgi:hypothetical protein